MTTVLIALGDQELRVGCVRQLDAAGHAPDRPKAPARGAEPCCEGQVGRRAGRPDLAGYGDAAGARGRRPARDTVGRYRVVRTVLGGVDPLATGREPSAVDDKGSDQPAEGATTA